VDRLWITVKQFIRSKYEAFIKTKKEPLALRERLNELMTLSKFFNHSRRNDSQWFSDESTAIFSCVWKIECYFCCDTQLVITANIDTFICQVLWWALYYFIESSQQPPREGLLPSFYRGGNWGLVSKVLMAFKGHQVPIQPLVFIGTKMKKMLNSQNSYHRTLKLGFWNSERITFILM
jgi:hypothetical protein